MTPRKPTMNRKPKRDAASVCAALAKAAPFVLAIAALLRELRPFFT